SGRIYYQRPCVLIKWTARVGSRRQIQREAGRDHRDSLCLWIVKPEAKTNSPLWYLLCRPFRYEIGSLLMSPCYLRAPVISSSSICASAGATCRSSASAALICSTCNPGGSSRLWITSLLVVLLLIGLVVVVLSATLSIGSGEGIDADERMAEILLKSF